MSKQDLLNSRTFSLRVTNIHCEGCKRKIKKLLQKINGVYSTSIDAEQGKVTVTGNVDPVTLIKKLERSGKHAELWGPQQKVLDNLEAHQLKSMQLDSSKVREGNKAQKGAQKFPQQSSKGPKELAVPSKTVKFNMPDNDFGDELYGDDGEGEFEVEEHHIPPSSKTVIVKGGGHVHAPEKINTKKDSDQAVAVNIPVVVKERDNIKGYPRIYGGGFLGCGGLFRGSAKKSNKAVISSKKEIKSVKESAGRVGPKEGIDHSQVFGEKKIDKKEKSKNDGAIDVNAVKEVIQEMEVGHGKDKGGGHGGEEKGRKAQMGNYPTGQVNQMVGDNPMGQMGEVGAIPIQGMPVSAAMNNGYSQGPAGGMDMSMGMRQSNPFEQQHYMTPNVNPMMTHQRPNGGHDMHQQHMMYGRPYPHDVNYVPPMPPPGSDPYTLYFSDENPTGCSMM